MDNDAPRRRIRVVALALVRRRGEILVVEGLDHVKGDSFFRAPGGAVEFGETAAAAVAREMMEEFGAAVSVGRQVVVQENLFTYNGEPGHEIVFVIEATFIAPEFYDREELALHEEGWADGTATWRPLSDFAPGGLRLVPEGLFALLSANGGEG